jgi:hypothetical protein
MTRGATKPNKKEIGGVIHWNAQVSGKRLFSLRESAEYLGRSEWGMRELIWAA